MKGPAS